MKNFPSHPHGQGHAAFSFPPSSVSPAFFRRWIFNPRSNSSLTVPSFPARFLLPTRLLARLRSPVGLQPRSIGPVPRSLFGHPCSINAVPFRLAARSVAFSDRGSLPSPGRGDAAGKNPGRMMYRTRGTGAGGDEGSERGDPASDLLAPGRLRRGGGERREECGRKGDGRIVLRRRELGLERGFLVEDDEPEEIKEYGGYTRDGWRVR